VEGGGGGGEAGRTEGLSGRNTGYESVGKRLRRGARLDGF